MRVLGSDGGSARRLWFNAASCKRRRLARSGHVRVAQAGRFRGRERNVLEKALAQDEPEAMVGFIARALEDAHGRDSARVHDLTRRAAQLGHFWAQQSLAYRYCAGDSLSLVLWLSRSAMQDEAIALRSLTWSVGGMWPCLIRAKVVELCLNWAEPYLVLIRGWAT